MLTNPKEVQDAIRGFRVGKAPVPNGIQITALNHFPFGSVLLLLQLFNAPTTIPSLEALPTDNNTQSREGSGAALILTAH
jgi:hypothetical protein